MTLTFRPICLDADYGDQKCVLVFRDERLAAVLTCLGEQHGEDAGSWYLEASFSESMVGPRRSFASLEEFGSWAGPRPAG